MQLTFTSIDSSPSSFSTPFFPTLSWNFSIVSLTASSIIDLSKEEVAYDISTIQSKNEVAVAPHIPHITTNSASTTKAIHKEASGS
jgi:hypothetical protein